MQNTYFFSHGSPLVLFKKDFKDRLKEEGDIIISKNPKAILVLSAHNLTEEPEVSINEHYESIYDFYGFDVKGLKYNTFGNKDLAYKISSYINAKPKMVSGLDHGAWVVLRLLFEDKLLPVISLSIPIRHTFDFYYDFGKKLQNLREDACLIFSGGAVHNLYYMNTLTDWSLAFKNYIKEHVLNKNHKALINNHSKYFDISHPTKEHYVPLLYFMGSLLEGEVPKIVYEDFEMGSISLLSFKGEL